MNISKQLKNAVKRTSIDPIFEELFEQHYAAKSHRKLQSIKKYELQNLSIAYSSIEA
jgi:hypothetical protein